MSREFVIMTDSTTDLPREFYEKSGVVHLPHGFIFDGVERKDKYWTDMSAEEYYGRLRRAEPVSTTQADMGIMYAEMEKALAAGKDVLYPVFSSKLSGTYNTSCMVGKEIMEKYPDGRIISIDTKCASVGQGMLVIEAVKMQFAGATMDEIVEMLERDKDKIYHFFTVDDLGHLKRGGRLSGTAAMMGTLIGIKPVLSMSDEGVLEPISKIRGRNAVIMELSRLACEKIDDTTGKIWIVHADCLDDAKTLGAEVNKSFPDADIYYNMLGPDVAAHVGCGTIGIVAKSNK